MKKYYKLINSNILDSPLLLKIVLGVSIFLIFLGLNGSCTNTEITEVTVDPKKPIRHALVIYKVKDIAKDSEFSKFKYIYTTDAQRIWSSEIYAIGDTLSFTTRKVKRQFSLLEKENISLKAELSQRNKNWEIIQVDITKIFQQYN